MANGLLKSIFIFVAINACCSAGNICCNTVSFGKDWCKHSNCFGTGCNMSTCPDISGCICNGRISYASKSFCAIVKACLAASADYKKAQQTVYALTGMKVDDIPNCGNTLLNVICAYQFPRCDDDTTSYETVCLSTCQRMYSSCIKPIIPCTPVSYDSLLVFNELSINEF